MGRPTAYGQSKPFRRAVMDGCSCPLAEQGVASRQVTLMIRLMNGGSTLPGPNYLYFA